MSKTVLITIGTNNILKTDKQIYIRVYTIKMMNKKEEKMPYSWNVVLQTDEKYGNFEDLDGEICLTHMRNTFNITALS